MMRCDVVNDRRFTRKVGTKSESHVVSYALTSFHYHHTYIQKKRKYGTVFDCRRKVNREKIRLNVQKVIDGSVKRDQSLLDRP
jgi:hypothetical protein